MRILGLLFILAGLWLCFTILLFPYGATLVGLGALLCIAGRNGSPSKLAHGVRVGLGVLIAGSCVFAAVAFFGLAMGVKPTARPTPAQVHQAPSAPGSSAHTHAASTHKPAR